MKVRFLADADLNKAIVSGVVRRRPSIDFLTARAAGLRGMKDLEVLELAAAQQRALVSHDLERRDLTLTEICKLQIGAMGRVVSSQLRAVLFRIRRLL